jgi:CHAT domain-containing protein/Tfp pilus assembly protein PilF
MVAFMLVSAIFLFWAGSAFPQSREKQEELYQKALQYKYKVKYDSAIILTRELKTRSLQSGDIHQAINSSIELCDLNILQRDFEKARVGLMDAEKEIEQEYNGDPGLLADYYQVKGSYFLAQSRNDSAKTFFFKSIKLRTQLNGNEDTLLHYAYNKLGNLYLSQSDFDSAYICHKIALNLSLRKQNNINYLTASSYQNLGIAAHMKGDFNEAEKYYTLSLGLKEQLFNKNDPALVKIYGNLGKFFSDLSKYDIGLNYYDKSEKILQSHYDRNNVQFAHLYWNKGNVYTLKGDYLKAINYLLRAYTILLNEKGIDNQTISNILLDLGYSYDQKGEINLAIEYYTKAAQNNTNASIIKIYRNLGNLFQKIDQSDSAEKYYHLSIKKALLYFKGVSYDLGLCYQYYGEFLENTGQQDQSLTYLLKAGEIFKQLFGTRSKDLAKIYLLEGQYYGDKKDYKTALDQIQLALCTLLPKFDQMNPEANPSMDEIVLDLYLPNFLSTKAKVLYQEYIDNHDTTSLKISLLTIQRSLDVIEEIRRTYNDEETQFTLNQSARDVIDLGVKVAYDLYTTSKDQRYLAKAFQFCEKGQAIVLLSALRGLQAQSTLEIPKNIQEFESNLTQDLSTYNNLLYQENLKKDPEESKIRLWGDKIFNLRLSYDSLLTAIQTAYPEFFRLKYDYSTVDADSLLKQLSGDQSILEYHLTDSLVYGFLFTDNKLTGEICGDRVKLTTIMDSLLAQFRSTEYFNPGPEQFDSMTRASEGLYDMLIRPFESMIENKRLIIVPDGELGYLSFDILLNEDLVNKNGRLYSELPWLIKSHPISYSSSATIFYEQNKSHKRFNSSDLLAFAPSYDYKSNTRDGSYQDSIMMNLSPLTGTKEEIKSIESSFRTTARFDESATESYFKKHAGNYRILHLAMHTIIDDENPLYSKLVFAPSQSGSTDDGYLNTYELFRLHLNGQLAVLSACNTGKGKLERGEGIISLARGFFYAGIQSVIMTLWEIEDHSSADLMSLFYQNLKKGEPYDIALQQAKLSYMASAGKLHSHPYFWAGYVNIGKTGPIEFNRNKQLINLIIIGLLCTLIIFLIYLFINNRVFLTKKRH